MPRLRAIEDAAGALFSGLGLIDASRAGSFPTDELARLVGRGQVWVACPADDVPVGMAIASVREGAAYVEEMDVLPAHGRRGLGGRLLGQVCAWAQEQGHAAVTLSTFRGVPWNAPFYRKHGFRDLEPAEWTPALQSIRAREARHGLRVEERVFMRRELGRVRLALANLAFPATADGSVTAAVDAIAEAGARSADIVCFPECFVPGYRAPDRPLPAPDPAFLEHAWSAVAAAAARSRVAVVLGTERVADGDLRITALVVNRDGTRAGFQDKVQLDPSEDATYRPGWERNVFRAGPLRFGVAICHEGWRYPETVRWAARRGAHVVFHPHFHEAGPGGYRPSTFADPANTFHEKAALCRAAENTCFFATVNFASAGSPTTSAVVRPDGTLLAYQPYGQPGLLLADIDVAEATGLLAARCRS